MDLDLGMVGMRGYRRMVSPCSHHILRFSTVAHYPDILNLSLRKIDLYSVLWVLGRGAIAGYLGRPV